MQDVAGDARQHPSPEPFGAALTAVIEQLRADSALKTWSLIITFFGDAVVPRGGVVAAATVQALMQRYGVEPGAVRTAFSRLVRDGWVVREKRGRHSFYRLSPRGAQPFESASLRIYANCQASAGTDDSWLLLVHEAVTTEPVDAMLKRAAGLRLSGSCVLFERPSQALIRELESSDMLSVRGQLENVPDWVRQLAGPAPIGAAFETLLLRFRPLAAQHPESPVPDTLDAIAARCLLIHEWRRTLLKSADVSAAILPAGYAREPCRAFVAGLYRYLLSPSEGWLDQQRIEADPLRNTSRVELVRRFA